MVANRAVCSSRCRLSSLRRGLSENACAAPAGAGSRPQEAPEAWAILRLVFLKKPDAKIEKGLRGFRAMALPSVVAKWYTTVLVDLLHEEERAG